MTVSSPSLPSSRELADLWPHFHPWQPHALWLGQLLLHRVEAPVIVQEKVPLDPLALLLLATVPAQREVSWSELRSSLGVPEGMLRTLLAVLTRQGCVGESNPQHWRLTEMGARSRDSKEVIVPKRQRRTFHFCDGTQNGLPAFVRWHSGALQVLVPAPKTHWHFSPAALRQCLQATDSWKTAHHFPAEVSGFDSWEETNGAAVSDSDRVILHHVIRLPLAVVSGRHCLGFVLSLPSWHLQPAPPLFHVGSLNEAAGFIGADLSPPVMSHWAEAWDLVRRPLGLPQGEVLQYEATEQGPRVVIRLPTASVRKKPLPTGDTWLLAGNGPFRCAARVEFREE
jgi:hypothetical protein